MVKAAADKYAAEKKLTRRTRRIARLSRTRRFETGLLPPNPSLRGRGGPTGPLSKRRARRFEESNMSTSPSILLDVNGIEVIYNHVILVLKGVSLQVPEGRIVALMGGNGAGKTTTLRAVSNLLAGERGAVTKGSIELRGERIERLSTSDMVERGVIQVMEGRRCFAPPHDRGEPAHRRLHAQGRQGRGRDDAGEGLRATSRA